MRGSRSGHEVLRLPIGRRLPRGSRHASGVAGTFLVLCAIAAALGPGAPVTRALEVIALMALAAVISGVLGKRHQPPHGWLLVDDDGLHRADGATQVTLVEWTEPFGVTVLASVDRGTILIAL